MSSGSRRPVPVGDYGAGTVIDPDQPPEAVLGFLAEPHLATLTTLRGDGSPHVVPVGFTYSAPERLIRIISFTGSVKVRNIARDPRVSVAQVDGGRWLSFQGRAEVTDDATRVTEAVTRYAARYRDPGEREGRVAIEIEVDRILGRA